MAELRDWRFIASVQRSISKGMLPITPPAGFWGHLAGTMVPAHMPLTRSSPWYKPSTTTTQQFSLFWSGSTRISSVIDIATLRPEDVGRGVIYTPHHHSPENPAQERGVISSWSANYVFVRYTSGSTAAATDPNQLEFEHD